MMGAIIAMVLKILGVLDIHPEDADKFTNASATFINLLGNFGLIAIVIVGVLGALYCVRRYMLSPLATDKDIIDVIAEDLSKK